MRWMASMLCVWAVGGCCRCGAGEEGAKLPVHAIAFGGDVMAARHVNAALFGERKGRQLFGDVAPRLRGAELAIVNLEGVISAGGWFADKGEPMPHTHHAHPRMAEALAHAGIDVVTVGNNHSGDYGRAAFVETLDRLLAAGIDYAGGGVNLADARRPAYRALGDTVVAVVGADLTSIREYHAAPDAAGTLGAAPEEKGAKLDPVVEELTAILREARRHAHVVLFSPHWGQNWKTAPSKPVRELARRLIRAGYDGILGHSSHYVHGVELIDGKPVVYDAGNILRESGSMTETRRNLLFELRVSRAGVVRVEARPVLLSRNRTMLATGSERDGILRTFAERSAALGTEPEIRGGVASLECSPGGIEGPPGTPAPPRRAAPATVRKAPDTILVDALPPGATPVDVAYGNGVRLVGYRLLAGELAVPWAGQVVAVYLRSDRPPPPRTMIHLEARGRDPKTGEPAKITAAHLPGDWVIDPAGWPEGKIVQDLTMLRLKLKPEGAVDFYAGLSDGKRLLVPASADRELAAGALLHLGAVPYREGAKTIMEAIRGLPGTPWEGAR